MKSKKIVLKILYSITFAVISFAFLQLAIEVAEPVRSSIFLFETIGFGYLSLLTIKELIKK